MTTTQEDTASTRWPAPRHLITPLATILLLIATSLLNQHRDGPRLTIHSGTIHDPTVEDHTDLRLDALYRQARQALLAALFMLLFSSLVFATLGYAIVTWALLVAWLAGYHEADRRLAVAPGGDV